MNRIKNNILKGLDLILQYGEGQFIEFKQSLDNSFSKEVVSFANASGGIVYLGITDDCIVKGISVSNKLKSQIQDSARNCDPPLAISIDEFQDDYDNTILVVEVKEGVNKPYSCSAGFFMRVGPNSQKMNRDEILALSIKSGKIRFDEQICSNFKWEDFDNDKFKYYLKIARISYTLTKEEILRNLRVLTDDGFTNAGVLYFAKEPDKYIISSKVRCVHFLGDNRVDILDKKVVDKGIVGNIEFAVEYLRDRVPVRYEIENLARDEFPEYPLKAYREAIVNAVIHFDYFLGDAIAIEKHKSSIVINNKGELLFPKEEFGKRSEVRNRLLADLLARTEFMEKAGTGIKRIRDACRDNGNILKFDFTDAFWTIFELKTKDVTKDVTKENRYENIIRLIKKNSKTTLNDISKILLVNIRTINRDFEGMKEKGIIKRVGDRKNGHWEVLK